MSRRHKKYTVPTDSHKADRKANRKAKRKAIRRAASATPAKDASRIASNAACHFLRIPLEMRLRIYGCLLLDPPRAPLDPGQHDDTGVRHRVRETRTPRGLAVERLDSIGMESCKDGYKRMDFEDDMLDIGGYNPYGIPMGDMCDGMFNDVYFINDMFIPPPSISTDNECESDERWGVRVLSWTKVQRHLAILRTNRQIYNEASALLHSDLTIDVNTDSVKQTKNIWRHGPSDGLGFTNTSGQRVYRSNLLNGLVEPHVFAQFQKVSYHADFSANFQRNAPTLHINDDLSVKAEDAAKFVSYLTTVKGTTRWFEDPVSSRFDNGRRQTVRDVTGITVSSFTVAEPSTADIVQNFVDIISRSPLIRQLEFIVNFEAGLSDSPVDSSLDSDSDLDSEQKAKGAEKRIEKAEMARERATELFMESGVLNCLCKLPNVKCFSLEVATLGRGGKIMKLRRKHLNIVRDLKETIEKNWMAKHGSD